MADVAGINTNGVGNGITNKRGKPLDLEDALSNAAQGDLGRLIENLKKPAPGSKPVADTVV